MWISNIKLNNIRCFEEENLSLSRKINIFIGKNNSGKSTVLRSILAIQDRNKIRPTDLRIGAQNGSVFIRFEGDIKKYFPGVTNSDYALATSNINGGNVSQTFASNSGPANSIITFKEPENLIYPFLANRKVNGYQEVVNIDSVRSVTGDFAYLYSRIDRISNPSYPKHKEFIEACKSILGITISASASTNGKRAGYIVNEMDDIPLPSMGDGVAHIASFIADLCHGDGHIFLIEELENDIHPNALKSLLRLIVQKSNTNQFCISTHSNIVLKELGGDPDTKVFYVEKSEEKIPTSKINIIETQKDRRDALEELGYDISDFYLWKAWLMFEESSAERLVRELLIPRFFPKLKDRLRTYSAKGKDNVKNRFNEINNIFVFLHLTEIYKNKVWILIDSGEEEKVIINDLISKYEPKGWNRNNFNNLSRHTIEEFYPNQFSDRVCDINSEKNKAKKDEKKEKLLDDVIIWGNQNPSEVEVIFSEIINLLGTISNELDGKGS